jgi:3-oxoacyl-[acyl-carrier protein] reductase
MKEAVKEIMGSKQKVDVLVNSAGVIYNALFQMSKIEEVRKQLEVNYFALYQLTQYIVKLMRRNHQGSIVNLASTVGIEGNAGKSAYGASKAAVIAMTKSIAEELGTEGIRANCIAPGATNTDMLSTMPDYGIKKEIESSFLGRLGEPQDVANTAVFLASDLSSYITGQVIRVDGGRNSL